jgi:hypothetical protein
MPWIKRNLFFVIGGLVAVMLIVFAGVFFFSNWQKDKAVSEELNRQISELNRLYASDPHPGTEEVDNISAAKQDQQRVQGFLKDAHKLFVPVPPYQKTDDRGFNNLLLNTIYELQTGASNAGVLLPPQYSFTFSAQRGKLTFAPGSIEPWTAQLSEIKTLCRILYEAKINALEGLRRVPVSADDQVGTTDYLSTTIVTNDIAIVTPYEVSFRSFSGEIGAVLDGILRSTNCLIVKTLTVEPSKVPIGGANPNTPVAFNPVYAPQPAAAAKDLASRYGGPAEGFAPRPSAPAPAPIAGRPVQVLGPTLFLSEKPLHVTLLIDVVKLKPPQ